MNILVLGGTGAIGKPLIKHLAQKKENKIRVTTRRVREIKDDNVSYIQGDARDNSFLETLLSVKVDILIDFMSYKTDELQCRLDMILKNVDQYIFISSARVYANSSIKLTEKSERLLDNSSDMSFLSTDEYALAKARQENLLIESSYKNWTIVRPYITYGDERLQLGIFEKEQWLYRVLNQRTIVFSKDLLQTRTTLTHGEDVSFLISCLVANVKAKGEVYQIASDVDITWGEVLNIYTDTYAEVKGYAPPVYLLETMDQLKPAIRNYYHFLYDRAYNRSFNSSKINTIIGEDYEYIKAEVGLKKCLTNFLLSSDLNFQNIDWKMEAYMNRITKEHMNIGCFDNKQKVKYIIGRYTPYLEKNK